MAQLMVLLLEYPNPRCVVFYNGTAEQPAVTEYRLSELYYHEEAAPCLELIVKQININPGYNEELMAACKTLREYTQYVEKVRSYEKQ